MSTTRLRDGVIALTRLADRDLRKVWHQVDDAVKAREALGDLLPVILTTYGEAAAALAAEWYDDERDQAGIRGRFAAEPATLPEQGAQALAGYAVGPLFSAEPDWPRALTLASGGVQLRVANASRETVIGSAFRDPAAEGWQRVGNGACAFCRLLIGRGFVYRSESSASFGAHDHCNCSVSPAWSDRERPVKPYEPTDRNITDADRARVREYLRTHDL